MSTGGTELAEFACLFSDRTRAGFLLTLLDGRARTAGELARSEGVAPSTATDHLNRLVSSGLLTEERQGRHRYVRLADARTANLVEEMQAFAAPSKPTVRTLRESSAYQAMARARTCYDHLAGRLGVDVYDHLGSRGLIDQAGGLSLTDAGRAWLADFGVDVDRMRRGDRQEARDCLDWTERRPHLAGAAGAALLTRLFDLGWIERIGSGRAVRVTTVGTSGFADLGVRA
jgi:DNA-binding transcriptional ArsR family regulator